MLIVFFVFIRAAVFALPRCGEKSHAAIRTYSGFILLYFRMHGAGVDLFLLVVIVLVHNIFVEPLGQSLWLSGARVKKTEFWDGIILYSI